MTSFKSQILGLLLASMTAVGCIAYEKIVKNFSLGIVIILALLFYIPTILVIAWLDKSTLSLDITRLLNDKTHIGYAILYSVTWITTPIWYIITKKQGIMVGSIYEVKYIIILVLFYIAFGDQKFTLNTSIGVFLALCSIYFISK